MIHLLGVILKFAVVLGIMVLVHELGHFLVGKFFGVRIETFSIGFGTRLIGFRRGDTDYRIALLPLGGYVKFAGEYGTDPADAAPGDLPSKPRWQRILIALAGPFSNFILAVFLLFLVAHFHHEVDKYLNGPAVVDYVPANTPAAHDGIAPGDTITQFNNLPHPTWDQIYQQSMLNLNRSLPITFLHDGRTITTNIQIASNDTSDLPGDSLSSIGFIPREQAGPIGVSSVSAGTPADRAGLKPGDQVQRVDNLEIHSVSTLHAYLSDRNGAPAVVTVLRNGQPLSIALTPERVEVDAHTSQFQIGFAAKPSPVDIERLPVGEALHQSLHDNRANSTLVLRIIQGLFTRHVSIKQMSGPVGIAQQIDIASHMGIWPLVDLMAAISLQLGIMNLLPFPPLDGGMIFFLLVESIMRRDVNQRFKDLVYQVAFVCVILFMFFVVFNDITKLHLGH
jgi:regulator of sigma E protease